MLNCSCPITFKDFVHINYHWNVLVPQKSKAVSHFIVAQSVVPYKTNTACSWQELGNLLLSSQCRHMTCQALMVLTDIFKAGTTFWKTLMLT